MRTSPTVDGWRAEGRAEGRAERRADDILRTLQLRFGQVPREVSEAVRAESDDERLSRLFDAAVLSASLEAFRATLGR
jgi:hypothetical protein